MGSAIKIVTSLLLLLYVLSKVDLQEMWRGLLGANAYFLICYICLGFLGTLVSAAKWLVLSRARGISVSLTRLFLLYMVGFFFNQILPTSVGGDVVRGYELGRLGGGKPEAMASVFMERLTGLTALIFLAFLGACLDQRFLQDVRTVVPLALVFFGYLLVVWMVFDRSLLVYVSKWTRINILRKLVGKVQSVQQVIHMYKENTQELLYAMGYSFLFYLLSILVVYVGCLTFGVSVSLGKLCTAVPVLLILFMVPISIGGIGLQEWAYYLILGMVGVPGVVGLSLGLLYRARSIVFGLLGGAIYLIVGHGSGIPTGEDLRREGHVTAGVIPHGQSGEVRDIISHLPKA